MLLTGVTISASMTMINGTLNMLANGTVAVINITGDNVTLRNIKTYINNATVTSSEVSGIYFNAVTGARVYECEGDGAKATGGANGAIYALNGSDLKFYDCIARNSQKEGLITVGSNDVEFHRCSGFDNGNSAVGTSTGVGLLAVDCYGENSGASGLTFNSQNMVIINPKSDNNASQNGITIGHNISGQYAHNVRVVNPIVTNAPSIGLYVARGKDVIIEGGQFYSCGTAGIQMDSDFSEPTGTFQISGGTWIDGSPTGIDITNNAGGTAHDVMISDVSISNFDTYGIYIMMNGDTSIRNCKLNADPAVLSGSIGIRLHGAYVGSTRAGTMLSASVLGCLIEDTAVQAILAFNLSQLSVTDNVFRDCNTSDSSGLAILDVSGVIPSTSANMPMPNPLVVTNNITKNTSTVQLSSWMSILVRLTQFSTC